MMNGMALLSGRVVHHLSHSKHHAGRTRIRVPPDEATHVREQLLAYPAARRVVADPATGSVVIRHDSSLDDLICYVEAKGIVKLIGLPEGAEETLAGLGPVVLSSILGMVVLAVIGPRFIRL